MPSSPITLWQIDGEKVETVTDLVFLGFKITADSDCSQEIKISLLLGRKAVTKLDSVLKNRNITLLTKSRIVKAMVFHVQIQEVDHKEVCESDSRTVVSNSFRPRGLQPARLLCPWNS